MKLTKESIKINTDFSNKNAERAKKRLEAYGKDLQYEQRVKQRLCKSCYYLKGSVLAGQGFTSYICKNCEEAFSHPNTAVPKYCDKCSDEHNACKKCGAKI
jgi:hypothetical protein